MLPPPRRPGDQPLRLVLGATGVGKTARSLTLAQELDAPVVGLDRVQTVPALAIGSGRPSRAEAAVGAGRRYLTLRSLAQGPPSAKQAADLLNRLVADLLKQGHPTVILEGGSCSLLEEMTTRWEWSQGRGVHIEYLAAPDDNRYRQQVLRRVEGMLGVGDPAARTMLDELGEAWVDERHHQILGTIVGYREALHYCARHRLNPTELIQHGHEHAWHLVNPIAAAHLCYSATQRLCMGTVLRRFRTHHYPVQVSR